MDKVVSAAEAISSLFDHISAEQIQNTDTTLSVWKKILFSIDERKARRDGQKSYTGENLYYHSSIVDRKNGVLLIETDHPGWIQLFQMHQAYIVRGFKKFAPELKISTLSFRLKGQRAEIFGKNDPSTREEQKKAVFSRTADTDEAGQVYPPGRLPDELQQIFDRIRENDLTQKSEM